MTSNAIKSPIIGISATLLTIESGSYMGRERAAVVSDYIEAIRLSGGIPLVLPVIEGKECIQQQMQVIDGLLLTGGYDVSPLFYQEEPLPQLKEIRPNRDLYEIQLLQMARSAQQPILGICRGAQIMNVAFGGTLYQDIDAYFPSALQHLQKGRPEEASHSVELVANTKLERAMGEKMLLTNSFHHQAIKSIASGFIANAYSKDGLVEGIESGEDPFILGVQWHPELMFVKHPKMLHLFQAFVEAARYRKRGI